MNIRTEIEAMVSAADALPALAGIREWVKKAEAVSDYGAARLLLEVARERYPEETWIVQQLALCTYKDAELPTASRLAEALRLLESIGLRGGTQDAETLALGGAVCKQRWQSSGQVEALSEAVEFYRAAHAHAAPDNPAYGGVNAAFLLDVLAARAARIARRNGGDLGEAEARRAQARQIRREVVASLETALAARPEPDYWFAASYAETLFGLGEYGQAGEWLARAAALPEVSDWQKQSTFRQLVSLARQQEIPVPAEGSDPAGWHSAWKALERLLGSATASALSCYRGRVGLALSGGGFRASLFHLGVMARLAEMDVLRSVEVVSTVSGGSIVAAHYYLEVRNLLQSKPDAAITRDDYLAIVRRVQDQFLKGVQTNIRMRAFADLWNNLKLVFAGGKGRSHRLGELYESELYARVEDGHAPGAPRTLPELLVRPAGEADAEHFNPNFGNWRRRAKVPVLLLNSTSLNSGHNWQFTARWMGEPPGTLGQEVDMNRRLRRTYYAAMPTDELKHYRLGYGVAASACVPGLFDPLNIAGLYEGLTVRLVDGGVHDNQGAAGLLDENCTLLLCSDASAQMADAASPADDPAGVLVRASSVLQDRVREAQYENLRGRVDSHALEGLFFIHTKKELEQPPLNPVGGKAPVSHPAGSGNTTSYGIDRGLQARIAGIRTDLDSFTEVEAYSLMASGYLITCREFSALQQQFLADGGQGTWGDYDVNAPRGDWPFRVLEPLLAQPAGADARSQDLALQLGVAGMGFFKAFKLVKALKVWAYIAGALLLLLLVGLLIFAWNQPALCLKWSTVILGLLMLIAGMLVPALRWLSPKDEAKSFFIKVAIAVVGAVVGKLHLGIVDRMFLARGKLERLLNLK